MKRLIRCLGAIVLVMGLPCIATTNEQASPTPVSLTVRLPDPGQKLLYV
ncbi:MAG: hypothetical protein JSS59_02035, partial [Proteobacteria bacterium]|nr:hypothetical protein [Pseudomonadota bacterium]